MNEWWKFWANKMGCVKVFWFATNNCQWHSIRMWISICVNMWSDYHHHCCTNQKLNPYLSLSLYFHMRTDLNPHNLSFQYFRFRFVRMSNVRRNMYACWRCFMGLLYTFSNGTNMHTVECKANNGFISALTMKRRQKENWRKKKHTHTTNPFQSRDNDFLLSMSNRKGPR